MLNTPSLFFQGDCSFDAAELYQKLRDKVVDHPNCQFEYRKIKSFETDANRIVRLRFDDDQQDQVEKVVFAVGSMNHPVMNPWTVPSAGLSLNFQSSLKLEHQVIIKDQRLFVTPTKEGFRLTTGYFMGTPVLSSMDKFILGKKLEKFIQRVLPSEDITLVSVESGSRPMSPDGLPIVGAHPYFENAFILNGLGELGHNAPALAKILMNQINGESITESGLSLGVNAAMLTPQRFEKRNCISDNLDLITSFAWRGFFED